MLETRRDLTHLRLGSQGRLVIPAELRRRLGLEPGTELVARIEEGRLVLEPPDNVLRRLRQRFAALPEGTDLAGELIAERRREAAAEAAETAPGEESEP